MERERDRETASCLHTNVLFWLGFLESETQFLVNQSILSQRFQSEPMRGSRKFWSNSLSFLGERGSKYHLKRAISGPPAKMAFCWRADDGLTLNAGFVALRISGHPVQSC